MIDKIANILEKQGCKTLIKENFSFLAKCNSTYIAKSPNIQWTAIFPVPKLKSLQQKIVQKRINPQNVDTTLMTRSGGGWSRMIDHIINDEIAINSTPESIEQINDNEIKILTKKLKDQSKFLNKDIQTFNIQDDFIATVKKIADRVNDIYTEDLRESFNAPVVCHSNHYVQPFWTNKDGDILEHKVQTNCVIDGIKNEVENIVEGKLKKGQTNQFDIRYINSYMDTDKNFTMSNVHLFQKGTELPLISFFIANENILEKKDFMERIKKMEQNFVEKTDTIKPISMDVFTRYMVN